MVCQGPARVMHALQCLELFAYVDAADPPAPRTLLCNDSSGQQQHACASEHLHMIAAGQDICGLLPKPGMSPHTRAHAAQTVRNHKCSSTAHCVSSAAWAGDPGLSCWHSLGRSGVATCARYNSSAARPACSWLSVWCCWPEASTSGGWAAGPLSSRAGCGCSWPGDGGPTVALQANMRAHSCGRASCLASAACRPPLLCTRGRFTHPIRQAAAAAQHTSSVAVLKKGHANCQVLQQLAALLCSNSSSHT